VWNNIIKIDPYLEPYKEDIKLRADNFAVKKAELLKDNKSLSSFANGYMYFGINKTGDGWVYREWAPEADAVFLTGEFNNWDTYGNPLKKLKNGVFELTLEGKDALKVGQKIETVILKDGKILRRVPSYATRVVQDPVHHFWRAEVSDTICDNFVWTDDGFKPQTTPYIYECHIGMSGEEGRVNSFDDFRKNVLPRIKKAGYNTLQIMAIAEHPYYASFGYQVSSFFAVSSRFGTPKEFKELINTAHKMGIAVLLDLVHSHSIANEGDGLNMFDGSDYQYFHQGNRGNHPAWGTKLFDYGKNEVIHFLLSNIKFWMDVYHIDGFRFDGVTSMLYHDHGLGSAFTNYDMYFSLNTDTEAVTYLQLANELIHEINPRAITVAEDMSGMPGMCIKTADGGIGFDYRLSMGVPDLWIKLIKDYSDDDWNMDTLWYELTTRRPKEKNVGYCESHDQALVGDKTIIFRLCDSEMYRAMSKDIESPVIDRGIALFKMIKLITYALAGEGVLNFMGNEFGHPEWIDFPREGNGWSYHYCRRQWSLADNNMLRYSDLLAFDKNLLSFLKRERLLNKKADYGLTHNGDKVLTFTKGKTVFAFNFNPLESFTGYFVPVKEKGEYSVVFTTDSAEFGGFERVDKNYKYKAETTADGRLGFKCYLPSRAAIVFKKV